MGSEQLMYLHLRLKEANKNCQKLKSKSKRQYMKITVMLDLSWLMSLEFNWRIYSLEL